MSNEFENIIETIQKSVDFIFNKLDAVLEILQGKLENRDDSGLCGDVNKNTESRRRFEEREDDIDKNTDFRQKTEAGRSKAFWISISAIISVIGKIIYDALK